ncbi:Uma2 family endonuclease [Streptomyces alboniger]|uniref:Uma2 family endonuclease n=1 Tax=Streptomyces alboniger TaxID=132473 RepID=A0A5J6HLY7_STRAD|nr:Uma2 family endonuclease [Streptomyces alboniger]
MGGRFGVPAGYAGRTRQGLPHGSTHERRTRAEDRDREVKPRKYAEAGIPHYWLVEQNRGLPVVYVYELDPLAHSYSLAGIFHDRLKLTAPFPLDVDLTAVRRR